MNPAPIFTIAQYASALGIGNRAARKTFGKNLRLAMRGKEINGRIVGACPVAALPLPVRQRLADKARQASFRDADDLLSHGAEQWQPEISIGELHPACVEKAAQLREVLAPVLRASGETASISELTRASQAAFTRVRRYELKDDRSVRRWLERAMGRDRGRGEWERIELYLDDRLARREPVSPLSSALLGSDVLGEALALLENPVRATLADRENLWRAAIDDVARRVRLGQSERAARGEVLDALMKSGAPLARNRAALQKSLERKWHRWMQSGGKPDALKDRRPAASGNFRRPEMAEADRNRLLARSLGNGGRLAQAYRELWDEHALPSSFYQSYTRDECDKSRVPKQIRDALRPEIEKLKTLHIGPKEAKLRGPKCTRDWSQMPAGVQAQADDCTLPVYFWIQLEDGSFKLLRGQFLPWIDTRTTYIHCFQLLPSEGYGSVDICRGLIKLNEEFGLPEELSFERGIWQKSLLISGRGDEVPFKDRVYGLKDLGIKISHALDPSAKVVENVLGILQNRMEREPGYCGRDERRDCPEAVARAKRAVESGKCHPREFFYSYAEWIERLNHICDAYNDEVQHGKKLNGLTPRNAFVRLQAAPPMRLDEGTRYLLASHQRVVSVTARGATIKIGQTSYTYKSEDTGRLIGRKVLAWFDLEDPSLITLTTLDRKNPVTVKRETVLAAWRAPKEAIAQAKRENAAHMSPARLLYSTLKKEYPEELGGRFSRPVLADAATRELGAEIGAQKATIKAAAARAQRTRRGIAENARRAGLQLPDTDDPRRLEGQKKVAALMNITE